MKYVLVTIFFTLFSSVVVLCQGNWKIVSLDTIGITAKVFEESIAVLDTLYLNEGSVYLKSWKIELKDEGQPVSEYSLRMSNYPSGYIHSDSNLQLIEGFLNSTVNSVIEDQNFEYLNSSLAFINGFPGKNFKFRDKRSNELRESKVYLIQNHLVEFITVSRSNNWFSKNKGEFFNSLDLDKDLRNKIDYGVPIIEEDSYVVSFPDNPETKEMFVDSEIGIVHTKIKILETDGSSGVLAFAASESKYSDSLYLDKDGIESLYDESMNGSLNSMNAELISKRQISYNDIAGREFLGSLFEGKATSCNRIFYYNGTLYSQAVLFVAEDLGEIGMKFLDSFELNN